MGIWIDIFFLGMKVLLFFISMLLATLLCRPSLNLTKRTAIDPYNPDEMIDISKIRRGPKLEGYAFANFGYSSETDGESHHEMGNSFWFFLNQMRDLFTKKKEKKY